MTKLGQGVETKFSGDRTNRKQDFNRKGWNDEIIFSQDIFLAILLFSTVLVCVQIMPSSQVLRSRKAGHLGLDVNRRRNDCCRRYFFSYFRRNRYGRSGLDQHCGNLDRFHGRPSRNCRRKFWTASFGVRFSNRRWAWRACPPGLLLSAVLRRLAQAPQSFPVLMSPVKNGVIRSLF